MSTLPPSGPPDQRAAVERPGEGVISMETAPPQLVYQPGLEGLRSVLLFLVIVAHTMQFLVPSVGIYHISAFGSLTTFYVLTGFLVTAIVMRNLERKDSIDYVAFMKRRFVRIGAPIVLFALVHLAWAIGSGEPLFAPAGTKLLGELASVIALVTFTLNWVPTFDRNQRLDMVQMWSLGVDMQFYAIWPVVWILIRRYVKKVSTVLVVLLVLFIVMQIVRGSEYLIFRDNRLFPSDVYQRPENSFDAFLGGAFICVLWKNNMLPTELFRKLWIPSAVLFVVFSTFVVAWSWVPYFGGYMVAALYSMVILAESMREGSPIERFFSSTIMRAIGRVSFSAYIWHLFVFVRVNQFVTGEVWGPLRIAIAYAALAIVTVVAWCIAERPFMRLPPVRRPAPVPT
jgi:peptidoglycan/LPS O-acetylase OafA/YrhL